MTLEQYIDNINKRYKLGNATEHTFRGDLQQLLESLVPDIRATNEPKRQTCGAPDYIITKKDIPVGFIEAKDIADRDLDGVKKTGNKEQFDRYKASLNNLIFTDYLDFHLYREGVFVTKIAIARLEFPSSGAGAGVVVPLPENFATFTNLIKDFTTHIGQTIKSSKKLAEMMAGKARLLSDVIEKALTSDETHNENSTLKDQMNAFKQILIHDITPKGFADVYAQTIAYGMFAARLHDPTLPTFSRQEAAELIPKSNPFLRKLFGYIAGPDIDDRIKWIVDSLVEIFLACNVEEILKNYGKSTKMEDPIIHFYETFLSEYDPKLRKARGVWYTPAPVVNFIVRAVDDILKTEFDLPQGLADNSKTRINIEQQGKKVEQEVHKVQILDPATGTGTFLAEVVKHIHKKFEGQQGIWSKYVETHLLPRLNGFELLMASYAMAHLKLDLLLTETGYKNSPPTGGVSAGRGGQRLRVYLTNSLEESHPDTGTLFANWLSTEANEANHIKRDTPVMCIIGNPPYSVSSSNKNEWIENLISDYKKNLNERKINLDDDYIKFIRYGQHFIDKNGSGVLAYISNNSFIDGITHRQMRKNLLESFDKIYILDLHGSAKKKEVCPDGTADQNVFDIMQGVSINIFVKTGKKFPSAKVGVAESRGGKLGQVFHYDLQGKREFKYDFLNKNSIQSFEWKQLEFTKPNYFFVPKNFDEIKNYEKGFILSEVFGIYSIGVESQNDAITIWDDIGSLKTVLEDFKSLNEDELTKKYSLKDGRDWKVSTAKADVLKSTNIQKIQYRPFDIRYTNYSGNSKGFQAYPRKDVIGNLLYDNIALTSVKLNRKFEQTTFFISNKITDKSISSTLDNSTVFPLYLYPETKGQQTTGLNHPLPPPEDGNREDGNREDGNREDGNRIPNLNIEIVTQIAEKLGLTFVPEKFPSGGGVSEGRGGESSSQSSSQHNSRAVRNTKNYMELPYNPKLKERAKELRKAGNLSEVLFWNQVKNKQFKGLDFDRQKVIGNYIVDFYCANCNVVIEIDGSSHDNKQDYDAERDSYLESLGLKVIHIPVSHVMNNMDGVMDMLFDHPALNITTPPVGHPSGGGEFAPIDILDYIYAVLHSPTYREKYKEFLKIDFPRVPYPKDKDTFWQLVKLGGEIRQIHLLESPIVEQYITQYPIDGDNVVVKPRFVNSSPKEGLGEVGKVYINETQYFDNVPQVAWDFYIGGYQPAQKWLKDRKERTLEFDDILHYQKIIVALTETGRLMNEIDKIGIE